jgi:hypothetical protein
MAGQEALNRVATIKAARAEPSRLTIIGWGVLIGSFALVASGLIAVLYSKQIRPILSAEEPWHALKPKRRRFPNIPLTKPAAGQATSAFAAA